MKKDRANEQVQSSLARTVAPLSLHRQLHRVEELEVPGGAGGAGEAGGAGGAEGAGGAGGAGGGLRGEKNRDESHESERKKEKWATVCVQLEMLLPPTLSAHAGRQRES